MPVGGRGGKGVGGGVQSYGIRNGQSLTGINEEIVWMSIVLAITIAVLITIALCYLLHENCKKRHDHMAHA
ncbi:uncharacterized protein LOC129005519 [Macrosteles quadrilineatus]|uniref:uncharacterized protein LOC129005484 n=1 Tax=Macrosteles quadrilineatus TaxID=74068 RepID=UPI0023E230AE|nr:uncharacterized protein LOC129005484 [Macrosteles quadrilineatus]XP_054290404.1 uncharacterized protein LOC129005519 [Macrosteles quadrilineatus]